MSSTIFSPDGLSNNVVKDISRSVPRSFTISYSIFSFESIIMPNLSVYTCGNPNISIAYVCGTKSVPFASTTFSFGVNTQSLPRYFIVSVLFSVSYVASLSLYAAKTLSGSQ